MSEQIILYDLPSKQNNECWSPNTWKGRAPLNFKKVPYESVFVPYTELEQLCKEKGIPSHPEGSFASYTLPIVRFPDGSFVMESGDIAKKLEATHPNPTLRLDDNLQQQTQGVLDQIIFPMAPFVFLRVYTKLITDDEKDWFREDRERRAAQMMGRDKITLEEWERDTGGVQGLLKAGEPGMKSLSALLNDYKQDDGPFISGSKPCYSDLMIVGLVEFYEKIGDGAYEQLLRMVPELNELSAACASWFERKNY